MSEVNRQNMGESSNMPRRNERSMRIGGGPANYLEMEKTCSGSITSNRGIMAIGAEPIRTSRP